MNANSTIHNIVDRFVLLTLLTIISFFVSIDGYSQQHSTLKKRMIDTEKWQKITHGKSFVEKEIRLESKKNQPPDVPPIPEISPSIQMTFYFMIIILVAFLIFMIISGKIYIKREKASKTGYSIVPDLEMSMEPSDLEKLLHDALNEKHYFLAVRIHFIQLIKFLDDISLVNFKIDKTNRDYLNEMMKTTYFLDFSMITGVYEKVWFGSLPVNENDYKAISAMFSGFSQRVKNHEK